MTVDVDALRAEAAELEAEIQALEVARREGGADPARAERRDLALARLRVVWDWVRLGERFAAPGGRLDLPS